MSTRRLWSRPGAVLASLVLLGGGALAAPAAGAVVPAATPNPGVCNQLYSVSALSATNVWAVGSWCTSSRVERTLVTHYNGTSWKRIGSPNRGSFGSSLTDVVALSRANVWAVGTYQSSRGVFRPLVEHWNGVAWKVVASPSVGTGFSLLSSVAAVSARDIWAVGSWSSASGSTGGALIEHWNGTAWKVVKAPANKTFALHGVAAVTARDVWATGTRTLNGRSATLTMHWNGASWKTLGSPNAGVAKNNFLYGDVHATSSKDVWVSGAYNNGTERRPAFRTLILHWNGSSWAIVPSPNRGQSDLYGGVSGTSSTDVWAVGRGGHDSLVEHWNGSSWSIVSSPSPGTRNNELLGVDALSRSRAFAVGLRSSTSSTTRTLVLRWGGAAWRVM